MSVTRQVLDGLALALAEVAGEDRIRIVHPGQESIPDSADVTLTPLSLVRIGRSRRGESRLDLELSVAVAAGGDRALDVAEELLLAAEATPHARIEPLPAGRPGLGFLIVLPVSVVVPEPSGPPVRERVVHVQPLVAVTGVVVDPDGVALNGVEVRSGLTRQQTVTDAAGRFALTGLPGPTSLTISRGARRATLEVPADPTGLRLVLPNHEGG